MQRYACNFNCREQAHDHSFFMIHQNLRSSWWRGGGSRIPSLCSARNWIIHLFVSGVKTKQRVKNSVTSWSTLVDWRCFLLACRIHTIQSVTWIKTRVHGKKSSCLNKPWGFFCWRDKSRTKSAYASSVRNVDCNLFRFFSAPDVKRVLSGKIYNMRVHTGFRVTYKNTTV